jgi:hypothetical protein
VTTHTPMYPLLELTTLNRCAQRQTSCRHETSLPSLIPLLEDRSICSDIFRLARNRFSKDSEELITLYVGVEW